MGEPYAALAEDASEALPPLEFTKLSLHYHFGDLDRNSKTADKLLDRSCSYIPQYSVGDAIRSIDDALNAGFRLLAHTNSNTTCRTIFCRGRMRGRVESSYFLGLRLIYKIGAILKSSYML